MGKKHRILKIPRVFYHLPFWNRKRCLNALGFLPCFYHGDLKNPTSWHHFLFQNRKWSCNMDKDCFPNIPTHSHCKEQGGRCGGWHVVPWWNHISGEPNFTTTIPWGRLDWECVTGPRSPNKFPWQSGELSPPCDLVVPSIVIFWLLLEFF